MSTAVPIGPDDIVERFAGYADEVVCRRHRLRSSPSGRATATTQTSDDEVITLLDRAWADSDKAAHGSGSSRHSPRNRYVAEVLHGAELARDWSVRHLRQPVAQA